MPAHYLTRRLLLNHFKQRHLRHSNKLLIVWEREESVGVFRTRDALVLLLVRDYLGILHILSALDLNCVHFCLSPVRCFAVINLDWIPPPDLSFHHLLSVAVRTFEIVDFALNLRRVDMLRERREGIKLLVDLQKAAVIDLAEILLHSDGVLGLLFFVIGISFSFDN